MYPVSQLYSDLMAERSREFKVKIEVGADTYYDEDIIEFSVEDSFSPSDVIEIGQAIPSKLTLKLRTVRNIPTNAEIQPLVAMKTAGDEGMTEWVPMKHYYVSERVKDSDIWEFTCYDRLVYADIAFVSQLNYPSTMKQVWDEICDRIPLEYDPASVVFNPSYKIEAGPAGYTCRQVLAFIAGAHCSNLYVGRDNLLKFKKLRAADAPVFTFDKSDLFRLKLLNETKTYTKVVAVYQPEYDSEYTAGTGDDSQTFKFENPFVTQAITDDIFSQINGFTYTPVNWEGRGYPNLDCGDIARFNTRQEPLVYNRTILARTTLSYKGGLKLTVDAPSRSDQESEFNLQGSLSQQINNITNDVVKYGIPYFGVTHSRTEGIVVEREDRLFKSVWNAQELTFYADGDKALWFDLIEKKFKFKGTLEGVDGIFEGTLSAVDGTFTGTLQGADGTFTGTLSAVDGVFTGTLQGVDGDFSGELKAATGTFLGDLEAAGGTFTGTLEAADGVFEGTVKVGDKIVIGEVEPGKEGIRIMGENNVLMLDEYGIDPRFIKSFKNMCYNSSFERFDPATKKPLFWSGGVSSPDSNFSDSYSLKLDPGIMSEQVAEGNMNSRVNPEWYDYKRTRISFYKRLGDVQVSVFSEYDLAPFPLTLEDGTVTSYFNTGWSDNWDSGRYTFSFNINKPGRFWIRFTNISTVAAYVDAVQIEPDFNGRFPSFYTDGPHSMGASEAPLSDTWIEYVNVPYAPSVTIQFNNQYRNPPTVTAGLIRNRLTANPAGSTWGSGSNYVANVDLVIESDGGFLTYTGATINFAGGAPANIDNAFVAIQVIGRY